MVALLGRKIDVQIGGHALKRIRTLALEAPAGTGGVVVCIYDSEHHDAMIQRMGPEVLWRVTGPDKEMLGGGRGARPIRLFPHDAAQQLVIELGQVDHAALYALEVYALDGKMPPRKPS